MELRIQNKLKRKKQNLDVDQQEAISVLLLSIYRGGTLVKVLCYKSEGRWFDPSWCHWNFSLT